MNETLIEIANRLLNEKEDTQKVYGIIAKNLDTSYNDGWGKFVLATDEKDAAKKAKCRIDDVNNPPLTKANIRNISGILKANQKELTKYLAEVEGLIESLESVS